MSILFNRIKKMLNCKCKIKDWSNDRFDFTDHTSLCYRGFKTEYTDSNLSLKTGNTIQEFILCKYCRHYRCKDHFGSNKNQKINIRKCCFDCLKSCEEKRLTKIRKDNETKINYSLIQRSYVDGNGTKIVDKR